MSTATQSPHLPQRMAWWISFFAKYNFEVKYKPGKQYMLADALSRRPDYELAHVTTLSSPIEALIRAAYPWDSQCVALFHALGNEKYKDRTVNYRQACGPAYIDIPSIMAFFAIAQM